MQLEDCCQHSDGRIRQRQKTEPVYPLEICGTTGVIIAEERKVGNRYSNGMWLDTGMTNVFEGLEQW